MVPTVGGDTNSKSKTKSRPRVYSGSRTPRVKSLVNVSPSFNFIASPSTNGQSLTGLTVIITSPVALNPSSSVILYENLSSPLGVSSPWCL